MLYTLVLIVYFGANQPVVSYVPNLDASECQEAVAEYQVLTDEHNKDENVRYEVNAHCIGQGKSTQGK